MDSLFVVNRHLDTPDEPSEVKEEQNEDAKLKATKERIERNREKRRLRKKETAVEKRNLRQKIITRRIQAKQYQLAYIPDYAGVNDIDEFAKTLEGIEESEHLDHNGIAPGTSKKQKQKSSKAPSKDAGIPILGADEFAKKKTVQRVLPDWLAHPTKISVDLKNLHSKVSKMTTLSRHLRTKLKKEKIKYFFPVQAAVIPYLLYSIGLRGSLAPRDICVSAPTGSGKTLAFVLPIIHALDGRQANRLVRALVILPTQDLAAQVYAAFKKYAEGTKLQVTGVIGGTVFSREQKQLVNHSEAFGYKSNVDIVIATPGRLVDHIKHTAGFNLQHLEFLVIDEADRVLDNVQNDWLYHLEGHIYKDQPKEANILNLDNYRNRHNPQKLLFSATLSQDPEKLHKLGLFQPKLFSAMGEEGLTNGNVREDIIGKFATPQELTEKYIIASVDLKPLVLYQFIKNEDLTKTLVFTFSALNSQRLQVLLQSMFKNEKKIEHIGAKLDMQMRTKLIAKFTQGEVDILIATDSLARGIDLTGVQCVISYSAPKYLETYIHRAGRTARAGENGLTVTMLHQQQYPKFKALFADREADMEEIKIDEESLESLGDEYQEAIAELKSTVRDENVRKLKQFSYGKRQCGMGKKQMKRKVAVNHDE